MTTVNESQSYLTHPDGTKIQVLRAFKRFNPATFEEEQGEEWDEAATHAAYAAHEAAKVAP